MIDFPSPSHKLALTLTISSQDYVEEEKTTHTDNDQRMLYPRYDVGQD